MTLAELILLSIALAMDAFAVSICKGLALTKNTLKPAIIAGLYFGVFQAIMPLIGFFLGEQFADFIIQIDHWIAFVLLCFIGGNMIKESREGADADSDDFSVKIMLPLAVATSIDALAVGVTFAFLRVDIITAVCMIGATTFIISALGVYLGRIVGGKLKQKAEFFGGVVLICIGTKILLEHTGII